MDTETPRPDRSADVRGWTVRVHGAVPDGAPRDALPAGVPGCVHTDLMAAGLLGDVAAGGTEAEQAWVAGVGWRYAARVRRPAGLPDGGRVVVVLEGVDTVGRICVDGVPRRDVRSMFRTYEVDLTEDLAARGEVELAVELEPALAVAARAERDNPLPRPAMYPLPYNQVRKMACSFGWDWGPATVTAGLWRPVRLVAWSGARFADVDVRAQVGATGPQAHVDVRVRVDGTAADVEVVLAAPDGEVLAKAPAGVRDGAAALRLDVPHARRWEPAGDGDQPLYTVTATLRDAGGAALDVVRRQVGFRHVEVVQVPDADGTSFALHVNGRRVWVRGLNWIPDDPFPHRVTPQRYRDRLAEAVAAGANAVRVWGGGIPEDDAFYDACDALGLLVVQDFPFACAAYPEDAATVAEVRAEAQDAVRRLRHRASLVLWCGNNENLWGHEDWDWKAALAGRPWGAGYYYEVLPAVLAELDPDRAYVPGSPFSPGDAHPNDPRSGLTHVWDVWNERDYADYETYRPRFVSEFGWQAPASWPTLAAAGMAPDPADPVLAAHQKALDGARKLATGIARHWPVPPASGIGWYVATQLTQARAVTTGIAHLRSLHDTCSGAVWWQLNDCWPAVSWSVVDVAGRRKLAWHALRQVFAPRLVALALRDGRVVASLVNDTDEPWATGLVVRAAGPAAAPELLRADVTAPARGQRLVDLPAPPPGTLALLADADGRRAARWLVGDLALDLAPHAADVAVRRDGDVATVRVTARTLLRDVVVVPETVVPDAVVVEGGPLTLTAGETGAFVVRLPAGADVGDAAAWADVVWSDNRLRDLAR